MDYKDFIALPEHPRQRDTSVRGPKVLRQGKLAEAMPQHWVVMSVVRHCDGKEYKCDGHTRSFLWGRNEIPLPTELLTVIRITTRSEEEFQSVYAAADNPHNTKNISDTLFGVLKSLGFHGHLNSKVFTKAGFNSAFEMVFTLNSLKKHLEVATPLFRAWAPEILMADQVLHRTNKRSLNHAALAAMLYSLRMYGPSIIPFWEGVFTDQGLYQKAKMDGIFGATAVLKDPSKFIGSAKSTSSKATRVVLAGRFLACLENWRHDKLFQKVSSRDWKKAMENLQKKESESRWWGEVPKSLIKRLGTPNPDASGPKTGS